MSQPEFESLVREAFPKLTTEQVRQVLHFRRLVVDENTRQNLTRLLAPKEFVEGHVVDAIELIKSGLVSYPAMDLGSGGGVPGLLCGALGSGPWVLAESEGRKAEFLSRSAEALGAGALVSVYSGRGEDCLKKQTVESIVARAVGPVGRIYGWMRGCSTWNSIVLLKGRSWEEEWNEFQRTGAGKHLKIAGSHEYLVGDESKRRVIIRLERTRSG